MWVRRIGWVLAPFLVLVASAFLTNAFGLALDFWPVLPSLVATILVGVRVRERWWVKTMPVAIVALCLAATALLVAPVVVELVSSRGDGAASNPNPGLGFLLFAMPLFALVASALYVLPAALGVWWGKRRDKNRPGQG